MARLNFSIELVLAQFMYVELTTSRAAVICIPQTPKQVRRHTSDHDCNSDQSVFRITDNGVDYNQRTDRNEHECGYRMTRHSRDSSLARIRQSPSKHEDTARRQT